MASIPVGALSCDLQGKQVGACHPGPWGAGDTAHRDVGPDMNAEAVVNALQVTFLVRDLDGAAEFLPRLKEELHRTRDLLPKIHEDVGGAQQGGGVAVVTAGVHRPFYLRLIGRFSQLLDGKGVHIGPESNGLPRLAALDGGHDACGAGDHLKGDAELFQLPLNQLGGLELLQAELRMHMEMAPQLDHIGLVFF